MKKLLYPLAAIITFPIVFIAISIYSVLFTLQLLFRTVNIWIDKGLRWIYRNITPDDTEQKSK